MPFKLFTSNRLEVLVDALAESLSEPLDSPFEKEIVVVQSKGMERWVSLEISKKVGICANVQFPFPNRFVTELAERLFPDESFDENSVFEPRFLTWEIMRHLPKLQDRTFFQSVKKYLEGSDSHLKRLQLAGRLADLYDQYLLFRPDMIAEWEKKGIPKEGAAEIRWQSELWLEIIQDRNAVHRAELGRRVLEALNKGKPKNLPERVTVFGISALPRFHIQVLAAVAKHAQVNLFLMNPCKEYWGDIRSEKEILRAQKKLPKKHVPTEQLFLFEKGEIDEPAESEKESLYFEQGNRLLASMGKLGRDFFDLIESEVDYDPVEQFVEPEEKTLLASLQSDILNLRDRGAEDETPVEPDDGTIQIHACHSERREVEVLHDHLLDLFERDPNLKPGDIIVMTPDIEKYAPYIQAVFDYPADDKRRIPFSIADRSFNRENEIIDSFLAILNLYNSRLTATEVLNILENKAIQRRFGLSEDDLQQIQNWVHKTRIRWGADAEHRGKMGLPSFQQNTWRAGLDRLLLGYALPGEEKKLYRDRLVPYDEVEGSEADVLSGLVEFTNELFKTVKELNTRRRLSQWREFMITCLERFFEARNEALRAIYVIRKALLELDEYEKITGFDEPIDIRTVIHHLKNQLYYKGHGYGFLTGRMTFCSMLPMRSIPFKVVCLIGMNNNDYPRADLNLGFDLIARKPRQGDRSRRNDDRYIVLEALLSARDLLYISYIGQNIKDDSDIPPSVVVSELLDHIAYSCQKNVQELRKLLVTRQHLQAFSPKYFSNENGENKLFSYSRENLAAALSFVRERGSGREFFASALPPPEDEFKTVSLAELYRFFRNPAQFLLNRRFGIYVNEEDPESTDAEAFSLERLDRYEVANRLTSAIAEKVKPDVIKGLEKGLGYLPHGAIGEYQYQALQARAEAFVAKTKRYVDPTKLTPEKLKQTVGDFQIVGDLDLLTAKGNVLAQYGSVDVKRLLRLWLNHLVLNCLNSAPAKDSYLFGVDSAKKGNWRGLQFEPVADASAILEELLNSYWQGLMQPLRFFPKTSWTYVTNLKDGEGKALSRAGSEWSTDLYPEKDNPYYRLCFNVDSDNFFNDEFRQSSLGILEPIIQYRKELS